MTDDDLQVIARMKERAAQCRRLANAVTDRPAAAELLKMANDLETDIARMEIGEVPSRMPLPPNG